MNAEVGKYVVVVPHPAVHPDWHEREGVVTRIDVDSFGYATVTVLLGSDVGAIEFPGEAVRLRDRAITS